MLFRCPFLDRGVDEVLLPISAAAMMKRRSDCSNALQFSMSFSWKREEALRQSPTRQNAVPQFDSPRKAVKKKFWRTRKTGRCPACMKKDESDGPAFELRPGFSSSLHRFYLIHHLHPLKMPASCSPWDARGKSRALDSARLGPAPSEASAQRVLCSSSRRVGTCFCCLPLRRKTPD